MDSGNNLTSKVLRAVYLLLFIEIMGALVFVVSHYLKWSAFDLGRSYTTIGDMTTFLSLFYQWTPITLFFFNIFIALNNTRKALKVLLFSVGLAAAFMILTPYGGFFIFKLPFLVFYALASIPVGLAARYFMKSHSPKIETTVVVLALMFSSLLVSIFIIPSERQICDKIFIQQKKNACYFRVAQNGKENGELCLALADEPKQQCLYDYVTFGLAKQRDEGKYPQEISDKLCSIVKEHQARGTCYGYISSAAVHSRDTGPCLSITEQEFRNRCILEFAIYVPDSTLKEKGIVICDSVTDMSMRENCRDLFVRKRI